MIDINALRLSVQMEGDIEPVPGGVPLPTEVEEKVLGACEVLGLNPLRAANKGKLVAAVAPVAIDEVLAATQSTHSGEEAVIIVGMTEKGGG
jgi:hydrogenase maturation factor